jgi:proteasome accessory factor A
MRRDVPFGSIVRCLTPFFVTRQIITGSGRVGIGQDGRHAGFQISQRADFMEAEVGLETTLKRPIINTRDEPHADPELYRRFHVIVGDANLSEYSTFLKLGMTSLVLGLVEAGAMADIPELRAPVGEIRSVSHDWNLQHLVQLTDGRKVTAIDVQCMYLDAVEQWLSLNPADDSQTSQLITLWRECLDALRTDPLSLSDRLDWVAKLRLMQAYRDRDDVEWDEPKLGMLDLQYSDVRPEKGIYHRLVAQGQMKTLITADQSRQAVSQPPNDTRAWFRGECIRRWGDRIFAASWDSIVFELPEHELLQRIPTNDPTKGTRELLETLLSDVSSADELVRRLQAVN